MQNKSFRSGKNPKSSGNKEVRPFERFHKKEKGDSWKKEKTSGRPKKSFDEEGKKDFGRPFKERERKDDFPKTRSAGKGTGDKQWDKDRNNRKGEGERKPAFRSAPGKQDQRFGKEDKRFAGQHKKQDDEKEVKRPNRYANAFGKLDDEELILRQKKRMEQQVQKEQTEEVTFSKELDKWKDEPVTRRFGKSDIVPNKKRRSDMPEQSKFRKRFDDENPHEKVYASAPKPKEEISVKSTGTGADNQSMPLNKFLAHCDVCSRRDAVKIIKDGKVTVNGEVITEPGHKVTTEDAIAMNGTTLSVRKNLVYILMNKPKGFITTTDDPKGRHTVMDLVENYIDERIFPVGRLDRNTTGLLLLTNDGELTQKLSHPKNEIRKIYKVTLDKNVTKEDFNKIKEGVILEDGPAPVDQLEYLDTKKEIGLEIHSGKNRIVRRIFESLGYQVEKLDRVMYAGLTKKNILRGKWRFLTKQEVINLKHIQ